MTSGGAPYPNGPDNALLVQPVVCAEVSSGALRGRLRGLYCVPQSCLNEFAAGTLLEGRGDLAGRTLLVVKEGAPAGTAAAGMLLVDVTGPWS